MGFQHFRFIASQADKDVVSFEARYSAVIARAHTGGRDMFTGARAADLVAGRTRLADRRFALSNAWFMCLLLLNTYVR